MRRPYRKLLVSTVRCCSAGMYQTLIVHLLTFSCTHSLCRLEAPASKETPTFLKARLKQGEAVAFLAHHKKSAVGFALAYPSFDTLSLEPCWQLDALWVAPSSRRIRVGTALLVAVGAGAKAAGVRAVIVHPNKGSDDAHVRFQLRASFFCMRVVHHLEKKMRHRTGLEICMVSFSMKS